MTKTRKVFSLFLTLVMLLSIVSVATPVYARTRGTDTVDAGTFFSFDTTETTADIVVLKVSLTANTNLATAMLNIEYDNEVLSFKSCELFDGDSLYMAGGKKQGDANNCVFAAMSTRRATAARLLATYTFDVIDSEPAATVFDITAPEIYISNDANGNTLSEVTSTYGTKTAIAEMRPLVKGVSLNKDTLSLALTAQQQLTAIITPANAYNKLVLWESSDTAVATVSDEGLVTAVGNGVATITVTTVDGEYSADCSVSVACVHKYGEYTTDTPATCTLGGKDVAECSICGDKIYQNTSALGHSFSAEWTVDVEPTCTTKGSRSHHCLRVGCDAKRNVEELKTIAHSYGDFIVDRPSTCIELGEKSRYCSGCSNRIDVTPIALSPHTPGAAPTCTEPQKCLVCEVVLKNALGHTPGVAATCTEPQLCTVCDAVVAEALGHNIVNTWVVDIPATTDAAGEKSHHCSRCDYREDVTEIPMLPSGAIRVDSVAVLPATGNYVVGDTENLSAVIQPADAFNKNVGWSSSDNTIATVTDGAVSFVGKGDVTITVTTEDGGKTAVFTANVDCDHSFGDYTTVTPATCTESGSEKRVCSLCNEAETREILPLGHNFSAAWTTDVYPTLDEEGWESHHCTRPGCSETDGGRAIPKLYVAVTGVELSFGGIALSDEEGYDFVGVNTTAEPLQLGATVYPANATNKKLIWASSNTDIATVSDTGAVTAMGEVGDVVITCTTEDGDFVDSCSIAVIRKGDVNRDGHITTDDARMVLRYTVSLEEFDKAQLYAADVYNAAATPDITTDDARFILRSTVGLETL